MKKKYFMIAPVPVCPEQQMAWQTRMVELLTGVPCFRCVYAPEVEHVTLIPKGPSGEIIADPLKYKQPFARAMREFAYGYPADGLGLVVLTELHVASLMSLTERADCHLIPCDVANTPDLKNPVAVTDRAKLLALFDIVAEAPGKEMFDYVANRPKKLTFPALPTDHVAEPVVTKPTRPMSARSSPLTTGVRQRPRSRYGLAPLVA
jgi:hypothetical protein